MKTGAKKDHQAAWTPVVAGDSPTGSPQHHRTPIKTPLIMVMSSELFPQGAVAPTGVNMKGVLLLGGVPQHLQGTAQVPLSTVLDPDLVTNPILNLPEPRWRWLA